MRTDQLPLRLKENSKRQTIRFPIPAEKILPRASPAPSNSSMTTTSVSPLSPSSKADLVSSPLRLLTRRFFSHGDVLRSPAALRTQASLYPLFHSALKNLDSAFPHGFLQQVNSVPSVEPF